MHKVLAFITALITLELWFLSTLPLPQKGLLGRYSHTTGWIWCTTRSSCIHEVGHKLDQRAGWISHSDDYIYAIEIYMLVQTGNSPDGSWDPELNEPMHVFSAFFNRSTPNYVNLEELYASMLAEAGGKPDNMPPIFRPFYDWNAADRYVSQYAP